MPIMSVMLKRAYNILLLGAPGVGKGTYGRMLAKELNAKIIESGAICRAEAKTNEHVRNCMNKGQLLCDNYMFDMIEKHILNLHSESEQEQTVSVLFDGFPRTTDQAQKLHDRLHDKFPLDLAIHFNLPHNILKSKLLGRRICGNSECAANYNLCDINHGDIVMPPMKPIHRDGFCDKCDHELTQRDDDNDHVIENRLNVFYEKNQPLIDFYDKMGLLVHHDIKKGIDDFPEIFGKIQNQLMSQKLD